MKPAEQREAVKALAEAWACAKLTGNELVQRATMKEIEARLLEVIPDEAKQDDSGSDS